VRVVHVARGRDWRGGERQVLQLMQAHREEREHQQLLVTGADTALARAASELGLPLRVLPWAVAPDPRVVVGLLRLASTDPTPTLLHAHDSHALTLARVVSRLRAIPLVATRRSDRVPGRWSGWRSADQVIAISSAVRAALVTGGVSDSRLYLIPSGTAVGPRLTPPFATDAQSRPLLAVGALTPEKGHDVLLAAFARLRPEYPALRLRIVGEGSGRAQLERLARKLDCATAVEFPGQREPIQPEMAAAAMLIQPSRREALGTAVLEAMVAGVPVIASRTGGLVELLEPDAGLLVPVGDIAALAAAIRRLLADAELAERLVHRAGVRVRAFSIRGMAEKTIEVYRSALRLP